MKLLFFLIILFLFTSFSFAQRTFSVDTTSIKAAQILGTTNNYLHFNSSGTQNIKQFNDSTFIATYPSYTTYLISYHSLHSFTPDSIIQNNIYFYINNVAHGVNQSVTMNNSSINKTGTYMIELNTGDTLRIASSYYHLFGSTLADTLKTFKIQILRFP